VFHDADDDGAALEPRMYMRGFFGDEIRDVL
jgi:hypothetical protein